MASIVQSVRIPVELWRGVALTKRLDETANAFIVRAVRQALVAPTLEPTGDLMDEIPF